MLCSNRRLAGLWLGLMLAATSGCYIGTARDFSPKKLELDPGWIFVANVPLIRQAEQSDCGAAALAMALTYWGVSTNVEEISAAYPTSSAHGIKAGQLREFARKKGLDAYLIKGELKDIASELQKRRPVVVGLVKPYGTKMAKHYELVIGIHPEQRRVVTLDPARGWRENSFEGFAKEWAPGEQVTLIVFKPMEWSEFRPWRAD